MRVVRAVIAAGVISIASIALAATHHDDVAKTLGGRTPGTPQTCIDNGSAGSPQIIDDRTLLYTESGRRIWRNDLPEACPGLRDDSHLIVEVYGSQLCQNDRFRAVDFGSHIPGPYCRFGKFVPYDKPKR
jgi:hypothetical protein